LIKKTNRLENLRKYCVNGSSSLWFIKFSITFPCLHSSIISSSSHFPSLTFYFFKLVLHEEFSSFSSCFPFHCLPLTPYINKLTFSFQKASEHKIKFTRVYWTKYVFTSLFIWLRFLFLHGQVKMKWNLPPKACYNMIEDYFFV
jgi:hypothetical protein